MKEATDPIQLVRSEVPAPDTLVVGEGVGTTRLPTQKRLQSASIEKRLACMEVEGAPGCEQCEGGGGGWRQGVSDARAVVEGASDARRWWRLAQGCERCEGGGGGGGWRKGVSDARAEVEVEGTLTEHKNALLHDQFCINYNDLDPLYRKGSIVLRKREMQEVKQKADGTPVMRERSKLVVIHDDMIRDSFWQEHPHLLCG
ncbi:hypothetical protein CYMTET_55653 [Cymbomonas tetramitiformis]|uniref:Thg1 C-terminal domain-containing protein n=1 Tax=Cymbomonas tetramitiformis TaxID=36881 RepID=A0AAE0BEE4_9CHLO|nr:hypothetical protein CYMTET_55653 [Cymbomonas tetramitiformis]